MVPSTRNSSQCAFSYLLNVILELEEAHPMHEALALNGFSKITHLLAASDDVLSNLSYIMPSDASEPQE